MICLRKSKCVKPHTKRNVYGGIKVYKYMGTDIYTMATIKLHQLVGIYYKLSERSSVFIIIIISCMK